MYFFCEKDAMIKKGYMFRLGCIYKKRKVVQSKDAFDILNKRLYIKIVL